MGPILSTEIENIRIKTKRNKIKNVLKYTIVLRDEYLD